MDQANWYNRISERGPKMKKSILEISCHYLIIMIFLSFFFIHVPIPHVQKVIGVVTIYVLNARAFLILQILEHVKFVEEEQVAVLSAYAIVVHVN